MKRSWAIRGKLLEEFVAGGLDAETIASKYRVPVGEVIDYIVAYHEPSPVILSFQPIEQKLPTLQSGIRQAKIAIITEHLKQAKSIAEAAQSLGIYRPHLYRLLNEYKLPRNVGGTGKVRPSKKQGAVISAKEKGRGNQQSRAV